MSQYCGTKYPSLAMARGSVEPYVKSVALSEVNGVYLTYLVAATYKHNKSVCLVFDMSLKPYAVEVETVDGCKVDSWTLAKLDYAEFQDFAEELGVNVESVSDVAELARKVLVRVNDRASVIVPAYRYQGQ